jgi:hypothetical protein
LPRPAAEPRPLTGGDARAIWELDQLCFSSGIAFSLRTFRQLLAAERLVGYEVPLVPTPAGAAGGAICAFAMAIANRPSQAEIVIRRHEKLTP